VRTVAEAVAEMVAGGRGSKRRRRKREGLQRGERNRRWLLVVGGWLCWLPVVELMMKKLVVSLVGGWIDEERERERKTAETGAEGLVFRRLWTPISPPLGHEMQLYL